MKSAHRNASKAKRKYSADPSAIYRVMGRIQPFTQVERLRLNLPPRVAYESIRSGRGEESDFHTLAAVVNVALVMAEQIDPLAEQTAILGRDAMARVLERKNRTGRLGFSGQDMQDLLPVLDFHEQLIANTTPLQMQEAMNETIRRMNSGQVVGA